VPLESVSLDGPLVKGGAPGLVRAAKSAGLRVEEQDAGAAAAAAVDAHKAAKAAEELRAAQRSKNPYKRKTKGK